MKKILLALIGCAVGMTSLLTACSDSDCVLANTAYTHFGFYSEQGKAVSLNGTITVTAAGTDSILINQESNPKQFQLPLGYTHQVDTFVIQYTERMVDSVFVKHTNIPHFISMDCGTGMYHQLEEVRSTHYAIDSIQIVNPYVDYNAKENIKIYYTTGL